MSEFVKSEIVTNYIDQDLPFTLTICEMLIKGQKPSEHGLSFTTNMK